MGGMQIANPPTAAAVQVTWMGGAPATGPKPAVVRWLGLFRGRWHDLRAAAEWEARAERVRAAEPLWRGKAVSRGLIGLGYAAEAVRVVRSADCWSEPTDTGRLTLRRSVPRRAWRDWHAFARAWNGRHWRPDYHAEAWLRCGAQPVCVAVSRALQLGRVWDATHETWLQIGRNEAAAIEEAARDIAAMLNVPTIWVGHVREDHTVI
jgi:hypothetical protein